MTLACVGRMRAGAERDLSIRYIDRARLAGRALGIGVELHEISESRAKRATDRKTEEAEALRKLIEGRSTNVLVFDEAGRPLDSAVFAGVFRRHLDTGHHDLTLVIGGPDGLDASIREAAAHVVAFGAMTWPHQLVRIMAAEQIYRAVTILSGHPYHRGQTD